MADSGERLDDCAAAAALQAMERAGITGADVDAVLVATTTADEIMPNAAPLVATKIGAKGAAAFDVGAACTGFLAALSVGASMIDAHRAETVIVIGADFMLSRIVDPGDRSTAAVFADGAGAVVLNRVGDGRIGPVILGSSADTVGTIKASYHNRTIEMTGHETFKEAVSRLCQVTVEAAQAAQTELDEIDLFVYHQANSRILTAVGERLELPQDRVVDCIGELGNTSAGTVPLALDYAVANGRLKPGNRVLVGAFGAGFTWGGAILHWGVSA
jgi:3-oxoacyl-[acyl-carrier-protein] synthase III